jgi:telomerase protein component 1
MASAWRTLRIFISSTFRDMQSERDYLVRVVFPELRERCARRRLHVVDVDLRWGVTEEEAERGRVLEICLDEIERCRPFFIGILGERYGSVLPGGATQAVTDDPNYDWLRGLEQEHSVTALEIYHGVLRSPERQTRSFFYFRDPAFLSAVPTELREAFLPESGEASQKLAALKNEIRAQCPVFEKYPCSYIGHADGRVILGGLESFGQRVLQDLWSAIDQEYPEEILPPDELAVERSYHEAFIETRVQRFIGRADLLGRMSDYASGDGQSVLAVVGAPGSGKSALLAKFAREYSRDHPDAFVLTHFIGASPGSTDIRQTLLRLSREIAQRINLDVRIPEDFQELWQEFRQLLERGGSQGRLVLVIDALNQLDDANDPQALHWLPASLPPDVRVIVSVVEGDFLSALKRRRPAPEEIVVGPLSDDERRLVVRRTLWEYRKQLDERPENDQMGLLLRKAESSNPLYLIVACEELRLFGEFERVTARVERLPGETEALFEQVLERLELDFGADIVRDSLSLLECARHGLLEIEMLEMLRRPGEEQLPRAVWAGLYRGLRFYLQPTGESGEGTLDFFHRQLAKAVRKRYLSGVAEPLVHGRLAQFFRSKIDPLGDRRWKREYPRGLSELPYHLLNAEAYDDLFVLARDASFVETVAGAFSADPQLTLEALRKAVEGAARLDDAGLMAEFVLAHARRRADLALESPLDVLRRGEIDRAWELADIQPADRCALWHLILAWELKDTQRGVQARATLDRLAQRELPRLSHSTWQGHCAVKLLAKIAGVSEPLFQSIQVRLLEDDSRGDLAHAVAASGQVAAARLAAEGVVNEASRNTALHMVGKGQLDTASRQAKEGDFASAMETVREIKDDWSRTAALREIASAQAAAGLHEQARAAFGDAVEGASLGRRWQAPALALRDIGVEQHKAGYTDDAMRTFRAAAEAAREHNPYLREKQHLSDVAVAVAEAGDIETALLLTREVSSGSGLNAVAAAHLRLDDVPSALSVARSISNPEDRMKALNLIAIAQVRAGQIESGREAFDEARNAALQVREFNDGANGLRAVAVAEMEAGLADESRDTFQLARQYIPSERFGPDEGMLKYLALAQAQAGELAGAFRTAAEIGDDDKRISTLAAIASQLSARGDHHAAIEVLEPLVDQTALARSTLYTQSTFCEVARGYIASGDLDGAIAVVQRAGSNGSFAAAEIVFEVLGHPASYSKLCGPGLPDFGKARETLGALLQTYHRAASGQQTADPETLLQIARSQVEAGDLSGAAETARVIPESYQRRAALESVARAHARARDADLAVGLIGEIQSDHSEEAIRSVAMELAGAGELDRAMTLVEQVDELWVSSAIAALCGPLARAGEFELARATLEKAGDETGNWMILQGIANEQIKRGQSEAARSTLADAVATAVKNDPPSMRSLALQQIAEAQSHAGFYDDAKESFALALRDALREVKQAESETDWSRSSAAHKLQAVAQAQARVGEFADALETTRLMRTEQIVWDSRAQARIEGEALRDIAIGEARAADFAAAHATASEIHNPDEMVNALTQIALIEAGAGQVDDAYNDLARALDVADPESDFDDEKERAARRLSLVGKAHGRMGRRDAASATMARAVGVARTIGFEETRGRALEAIVAVQAEIGDFATALESAQLIVLERWLSSALKSIALAQLRGGDVQDAVRTANMERSGRLSLLCSLAEVLADTADKENFKRLLLPCADEIKAANGMCALLSRIYPQQLTALAEAVIRAERGR